jgi:hypothetical protein
MVNLNQMPNLVVNLSFCIEKSDSKSSKGEQVYFFQVFLIFSHAE